MGYWVWTLVTSPGDIFSSQDITEAVEFLTVLYSPDEGDEDLVCEAIYFSTEECQGRLRKLSICLMVSRVSKCQGCPVYVRT